MSSHTLRAFRTAFLAYLLAVSVLFVSAAAFASMPTPVVVPAPSTLDATASTLGTETTSTPPNPPSSPTTPRTPPSPAPPPNTPLTGVTLPTSRTLDVGQKQQLNPTFTPQNFTRDGMQATWSSDNVRVATVSNTGQINALHRGSANITLRVQTADGTVLSAVTRLTVRQRATGITTLKSIRLVKGRSLNLPAVVQPFNANNRGRQFISSNTRIVRVDAKTGRMTARAVGTAQITVRSDDGGHSAVASVRVVPRAVRLTNFTLNRPGEERIVNVGRTIQIRANPRPSNATHFRPSFTSSNPDVARVDRTGLVTGVAQGSARITVQQGSITRTVTVRVGTRRAQSISLNRTSARVVAGESIQLQATVTPSNTSPSTIRWSSSNTRVATVDARGLVRTHRDGQAVITAKTWNNLEARVSITVGSTLAYVQSTDLRFTNQPPRRSATTGIVLHHTVGDIDIQQTHRIHIQRGMTGAAYHFLIDRNGRIWQGRPLDAAGGHVRGDLNRTTIGIAWRGNFENQRMTPAAQASGERLIKDLLKIYPDIRWIHGHRDLRTRVDATQSATACPGRNFPTQRFRNLLR